MTHLYTTRARFDKDTGAWWPGYLEWSRLAHLTELVSLDTGLNEVLVERALDSEAYWKEALVIDYHETGFFQTLDYVLGNTNNKSRYNLLAVVIEPVSDCASIPLDDFDFLGYDLLDQYFDTSALSNCGGFDETFLPQDLNNFGLIDDYEKAFAIKASLKENNPHEEHADTNVIAVWRHRVIGW